MLGNGTYIFFAKIGVRRLKSVPKLTKTVRDRYLKLYNTYLSDGITDNQREQCKADMIALEKQFGIPSDWK